VLADLSVRFPRRARAALRIDSVAISRGEHVLVVGPSGGGKSTLLHTLSGVVPLSVNCHMTGSVRVLETRTSESSVVELSRRVAVVGQDPQAGVCLPRVEQEIALVLENRATPPARISAAVDEALTRVDAPWLRHRSADELSGGESQRVALAAALAGEPDLLLVDEPTSMLDPAGVSAVREAVGCVAERGATVVMIEHRVDDLAGGNGMAALPARVLVLDEHGAVVADGPTVDTLHAHAEPLRDQGCWLPLDVELAAWTGARGGLAAPENRELLSRLAQADAGDECEPSTVRPAPPVLSAQGLAVARRSTEGCIVSGVDLEVRPGEVVALLGANAAGKSTLLLTLAGLLPPRAGRVTGPRPGLVFQNAEHQFVAETVEDEVRYGLSGDTDVTGLLRRHRLEHLAGHDPYRLSGGEKRRLSLAAMLAHEREVVLLDEPTLGLDRRDSVTTARTIREVAREGRTVILASHDLRLVATLADRVVVLADGHRVADGPTAQVLRDTQLMARAGLALPPLVAWLLENHEPPEVRAALLALDAVLGGDSS
jgi:energy-coupling factor transport system ATP-binding protein